ncbi:hypothetical protein [Algoriphagus confluentis]|uniref:hypothetical protein n=1 Tax=Algoriphagus confluentis TaxID=1697556 RepID=UPI0030C683C5
MLKVGEKPVFEEETEILVKNFDLKKESVIGNFTEYLGNDFRVISEEGKTHKLAFENLNAVSLDGLALEALTLKEFKNRYPKAYQVRNFGTKSDAKLIANVPDSLPSSLDYSYLFLKDKAELRLFWVEGSLIEAYLVFGQQQRGE